MLADIMIMSPAVIFNAILLIAGKINIDLKVDRFWSQKARKMKRRKLKC
jgi:hypothetical protein